MAKKNVKGDPYIYENGTLKNKLNITDYEELKQAECDIAFCNLVNLDEIKDEKCDTNMLKSIHKHIFKDIFDWAGEFRSVPIYKEELIIPGISLEYANPNKINLLLNKSIENMNNEKWNENDIDDFSKKLSKHLSKIWRIHPFRDGNTRTTIAYAYIFSKKHGIDFDISNVLVELNRKIDKETDKVTRYSLRDKFVLAALDEKDYPEPQALESIFKKSISISKSKDIER